MSLFGSIGSIFKGVATGIATGGPLGALTGGASAVVKAITGQPKNPLKTKNVGVNPRVNQRKGTIQLTPMSSPVPISSAPTVGQYSPAPSVRTSPMPGVSVISAPGATPQLPIQYADTFMGFQGAGASGGFMPAVPGSMASMYRRYYNKNGTPRRTRKDGMPYAVPRMNPMNPRAARRAIRRIRGARKLLQRIERSLPRARAAAPRRRAA